MPHPSRRLDLLEDELHALGDEAILVEELDGFVAGLLVYPDLWEIWIEGFDKAVKRRPWVACSYLPTSPAAIAACRGRSATP